MFALESVVIAGSEHTARPWIQRILRCVHSLSEISFCPFSTGGWGNERHTQLHSGDVYIYIISILHNRICIRIHIFIRPMTIPLENKRKKTQNPKPSLCTRWIQRMLNALWCSAKLAGDR